MLSAVIKELEREGFTLVGVESVLDDAVAPEGPLGQHRPDDQALADIEHGFRVAAALGTLDIGQAVIVQQGMVLGVEAIEGTDQLIRRCADLRREGLGGVLVKAKKPDQERRADLPTIGPQTVEAAHAAGLRGIAVEARSTLVVERAEMTALADRLGLFVYGRRAERCCLPHCRRAVGRRHRRQPDAGADRVDRWPGTLRRHRRRMHGGARARLARADPGLAVMGFVELVPAARRLLRRVRETAADIERLAPAAVVTIDSSGFCFRVGEALRKNGKTPPPIIHYVAPMVWAMREHRARSAARAADHLLTLFPFEPPYFEKVGLPATYVGHPVVEGAAGAVTVRGSAQCTASRRKRLCSACCPAAGPRRSAGCCRYSARRSSAWTQHFPDMAVIVPTVANVAERVAAAVAQWPGKPLVLRGPSEKFDAFAASNAALAASGTVALELAMARVPMVIGYRLWGPTYWADTARGQDRLRQSDQPAGRPAGRARAAAAGLHAGAAGGGAFCPADR